MKSRRLFFYFFFAVAISANSCSTDDIDDIRPPGGVQQDIAIVDNAVTAFMEKYHVPGLSLAITKDEKLVYVKAYGKADKESNEDVTTESLFRIASISKSITGIAFMKLVEEGRLSLDDKVFGTGALLGTQYGQHAYPANLTNIIRHLLNHTAGAGATRPTIRCLAIPRCLPGN